MSGRPSGSVGTSRADFERELGFTPDPFQRRAFAALDRGHSVVVAAPTGAGKTVVAEYAVAQALGAGEKAFYTTPLKALSNQKYGDFVRRYGRGSVGLLTGDNAINGEAPVVVMTTEVLRNMIYEASPTLERLGVVVLDEVHYLQDPYRGAVWEEVIIHLDPRIRLVCLSATVSNAEEFADWVRTVRGDTEVVIEDRRPVELEHLYAIQFRNQAEVVLLPTFVTAGRRRVPNPEAARFDPFVALRRRGLPPARGERRRPPVITPRRVSVVRTLAAARMVPAIVFIFSRAGCDEAVDQCVAAGVDLTDAAERDAIREIAQRHLADLSADDLRVLGFDRWLEALERGLAAHHAGLIPPMKEAVEEAFQKGLLRVVFATETLALGINMPARTVVIERLTKFTGERHEPLTPGDYTQLTGRAGRRGIDEIGYGVVLWNRITTFDQVASLASKRTYELTSSFRPTYNMAVNLVRRYDPDEAHRLLNLSFAQYRIDRQVVARERVVEDLARELERVAIRARCELGDVASYRDLLEQRGQARRAHAGRAALEPALSRLKPGDVVDAGGRIGPVVVLRRATGRAGGTWLTGLSERGRTVRLGPASFQEPPQPLGHVPLPEPFRPKSPAYRREVADALRRLGPRTAGRRRGHSQRLDSLDRRIAAHPVTRCPDLRDHLRAAREAERLAGEIERLERRVVRRPDTLARQFDTVVGVLRRRGYVAGWSLTEAGEVLSRLYAECDLLVAECLREQLFAHLDPPSLAALVSLFTYEARGAGETPQPVRWPTAELSRRARRVEELWSELAGEEEELGLPVTRPPAPGLVDVVYHWAAGATLEDVLLGEDALTPGDFVRNVKQLIDLLQQIGEAAPDTGVRRGARRAAAALFRGVVEASARVP